MEFGFESLGRNIGCSGFTLTFTKLTKYPLLKITNLVFLRNQNTVFKTVRVQSLLIYLTDTAILFHHKVKEIVNFLDISIMFSGGRIGN